MVTASSPVLVFDSGVGGLSVAAEIRRRLPGLPLHYLMDSAGFPYGNKDDDTLIERGLRVCGEAVAQQQPRMLVLGCTHFPLLKPMLERLCPSHCGSGRVRHCHYFELFSFFR